MSKIALSGPAGGTATYTVTAPTGATDRVITLPDQTATLITDSAGVLNIGSGQIYKDASGNVLVGTTTARNRLTVQGTVASTPTLGTASGQGFFGEASGYGMMLGTSGFGYGWIQQQRVDGSATAYDLVLQPSGGNVLVGTTASGNAGYGGNSTIYQSKDYSGATAVNINSTSTTGTQYFAVFSRGGTACGTITSTATNSTTYGTSSDYRLKENVAPMVGALAKVTALKPCTYTWKSDGSNGQGFIAHELQEVIPEAVVGEKDAIGDDGEIRAQQIDTSFLVATLTAAIQEQQAIITALTARVEALEGTQP